MKQRANSIWKWLSNLWGSFTKWITPVLSIGAIMVIMSVILIAFPNGVLQAGGTAILAAGLTIITTTLTGKESTRQQFAKEANTLRKDTIYGPLFIELKQIHGWLEEAKKQEGLYPYYIYGAGNEPVATRYGHNTAYPTFLEWPQFRQDYRIDSFTLKARILLDDVQKLIADYNSAMEATKNPAIDVLIPCVEKALTTILVSKSFKEWEETSQGGNIWQSIPEHNWYSYLKRASSDSNMSKSVAELWLLYSRGLGWLIAGNRIEAVMHIREYYRTGGMSIPEPPDISWFQGVIDEAWPEFNNLHKVKEVRTVAETLQIKVLEAKNHLESGIRLIRDQYEGGEPLV